MLSQRGEEKFATMEVRITGKLTKSTILKKREGA